MTGGDWDRWAACLTADKDSAFRPPDSDETAEFIRDYCNNCPVRRECLAHAMRSERHLLSAGSRFGVFGGLTNVQRACLARYGARQCTDCEIRFVPSTAHNTRCAGCRRARVVAPSPSPVSEHGTRAGYEQHQRRGERPCWSCREAKGRYDRWWRERQRGVA